MKTASSASAAAAAALFIPLAVAQSGAWGQCGGINWSGDTTCISGYHCEYVNDWYSQCLPGDASTTTTTTSSAPTTTTADSGSSTTTTTTSTQPTSTGGGGDGSFKWFGTDESCAEFGEGNYPGTYGTHYTWPDTSAIQTLINDGMNTFRISFSMERILSSSTLTSSFATTYLSQLSSTVSFVTSAGSYAVLDPHNYGRFYGNIITSTSDFQTFWQNLASEFKDNPLVIFDTNNEYYGMDQTLVLQLNQAAIDGIRAAGATSQYIFVEGNAWSGAWSWNVTNDNMKDLTDPQDMLIYEMHQYLDSDSSGTSETCVSSTIGRDRVVGATEWLRENGKVGIIGEFAGGPNTVCMEAVTGLLDHLKENSDVWMGALWWAAGPWWGTYMYSYEPPSGTAYNYYSDLLKTYV